MTKKMSPESRERNRKEALLIIERVSKDEGGCPATRINRYHKRFVAELEAEGLIQWVEGLGWVLASR